MMHLYNNHGNYFELRGQNVLILVVMDDALVRAKQSQSYFFVDVLILVVMDDALVRK